jgi:Prokaryotic RING finger family 4
MPQPYAAEPCGHLFCYYCLRSSTEADMQFLCPLCSERVAAMKPALRPIGKGAVLVQ